MRYSRIQYLCWLFSGAEISLLKECPADYNRQATIGFTIFMTCLLATLSGGFAAWRFTADSVTGEGNTIAAVVFGIVWGLLIFSIDRSMVVTLKKKPKPKAIGRWQKISQFFGSSLVPAVTRMILAGLLAFMISIPLETKLFEQVINVQLNIDSEKNLQSYQQTVTANSGISTVAEQVKRAEERRKEAEARAEAENADIPGWPELHATAERLRGEAAAASRTAANEQRTADKAKKRAQITKYNSQGQPYPDTDKRSYAYQQYLAARGRVKVANQQAGSLRAQADRKDGEASALATEYRNNQRKNATDAEARRKKEEARQDSIQNANDAKGHDHEAKLNDRGFVRQYVAMENAAAADPSVFFFLWFIRIVFFVIEILPTIVKLATPLGEYDRQVLAHEKMFALSLKTNYNILKQRELLRQQTELQIAQQLEQIRHDQETHLGKSVLEDTARRQNDLAQRILKEWHRNEKAKLAAPPSPSAAATTTVVNKATPSSSDQGQQSAPSVPHTKASFLHKTWQLQDTLDAQEYVFSNGSVTDNEVKRIRPGVPDEIGYWQYTTPDQKNIRIRFSEGERDYQIDSLTDFSLHLSEASGTKRLKFSSR